VTETSAAPLAAPAALDALVALYAERGVRFGAARDRLDARLQRVGLARLVVFSLAAGVLVWALVAGVPLGLAAVALLLAGFAALVAYHERLARARERYALLWQCSREARRRLRRDWAELPSPPDAAAPPDHPYAADLDLLGPASLQQLLGGGGTPHGQATLRAWLLAPADPATVRARQEAVRELAPLLDLRDELVVQARQLQARAADPAPFLAWAEDAPWLTPRRGLLWTSRLLPLGIWGLLVAQLAGAVQHPWWLAGVVAGAVFDRWRGGPVRARLARATAHAGALDHYGALFALLAARPWHSPLLRHLQATLAGEARAEIAALGRAVRLSYLRLHLFYALIELLTLGDWLFLWLLERWQARAGGRVRVWFAALGEFEALAALAALAHDHPWWSFPEFANAGLPRLEAHGLGHPLLPPARCVPNDVTIGPPGTVLVVTGSNMSGKSTLLRAIGVNVVLAHAGGPVCATHLRLPPLTLHTSMRVQDSLAQGVSYFLAELRDLKRVVDAAEAARAEGRVLLYLLDEILQGTNTAERQLAARAILRHLVALGAIGAVSTHDLTLLDSPELAAACRPVHFREQFTRGPAGPTMHFDYQLLPGPATSTNALRLMELLGLPLPREPAS
jgi:hypothetical protein